METMEARQLWRRAATVTSAVKRAEVVEDAVEKRREHDFKNMDEHCDRLSTGIKLAYCAPTFSTLPIIMLLSVYGSTFYEKLGADLALMSFFIALARSFDVISDPLMSYVTDSFRSRWGRRRPFCFTGCWFYAAFLFLLLYPPSGISKMQLSAWFGVFYILFFLMNTYTNIPYDALGPELTDNYDDRARLFFVAGLFDGFGALVAIIIPVLLAQIVTTSSWNGTTCSDEFMESFCYMGESCGVNVNTGEKDHFHLSPGFIFTHNPGNCTETAKSDMSEELLNFCDCMDGCANNCALKNERSAYMMVGFFFGLWYVSTMSNMVNQIKERPQTGSPPPPLVPSLLNTLSNFPFTTLLPAWACDAVVNAIVASMTTYFVRYVVEPEFQTMEEHGIGCSVGVNERDGTAIPGPDADSPFCDSVIVLGVSITLLLVSAVVSTPIWMAITSKIGKRKAWLAWSLSMACTNFLYIFISRGQVVLMMVFTAINGLPFGAKFLADAILADIIDYDEFLTGARSEATYTMFKSFLPKICAIPAAAIPIALLNTFGHIAPYQGNVVAQPASVKTFVIVVTVIFPSLLALLAFFFKTRFPLKEKEDVDKISAGVALHQEGEAGEDPVSGHLYKLLVIDDKEALDYVYLVGNFPGVDVVVQLIEDGDKFSRSLHKTTVLQLTGSLVVAGVFLILSIALFGLLEDPDVSFVPVLTIIFFGVGLTATGFSVLRLRAATRIRHVLTGDAGVKAQDKFEQTLEFLRVQREDLARLGVYKRRQSASGNGVAPLDPVSENVTEVEPLSLSGTVDVAEPTAVRVSDAKDDDGV